MFVVYVLVVCVCSALSHTCAKVVLRNGMPTYRFLAVRIVAGTVASAILYWAMLKPGEPHVFQTPGPFLPAIWLGILVPFGSNVFYFEALRRGDLCIVAPAGSIAPLFVALLAWPVLHEIPDAAVGISLVLIVAGLILSARSRHHHHPTAGAWMVLPILLASGTSVCNSFNYVFQKKLLHDLPKADINLVQNIVSLILFGIYFLWEMRANRRERHGTEQHPWRNVGLTIISGVLVFALSNLLFLMAIAKAPTVSIVMVLATLTVPASALAGWVLLHERPRAIQLAGGGIITIGAAIAKLAG